MSDVMLSYATRGTLLGLNNTSNAMEEAERRLASGKEVNFAHDDSYRYFTSEILQSRATDLDDVNKHLTLNSQIIQSAITGINTIKDFLDHAEAQLRIALDETDGFARMDYIDRYNELLSQIENVAENSEYREKNLLSGSNNELQLIFNESYTTSHVIDSVNYTNRKTLGLDTLSYGDTGEKSVVLAGAPALNEGTILTNLTNAGNALFDTGDEIEFFDSQSNRSLGKVIITDDMTVQEFNSIVSNNIDNVRASMSTTTGAIDFEYTGSVFIQHNKHEDRSRNGNEMDVGLAAETNSFSPLTAAVDVSNDLNGLDGFSITDGQTIQIDFENNSKTFTYGNDGTSLESFLDFINENLSDLHAYYDPAANQINYVHTDGANAAPTVTLGAGVTTGGAGTFLGTAPAAPTLSPVNEAVLEHDLHTDSKIESVLLRLKAAKQHVNNTEREFSNSLQLVENRVSFSEMMIETLEIGALELVEIDQNKESAKLLTLQTRQQLAMSALSISAQADQSILRIFG